VEMKRIFLHYKLFKQFYSENFILA
jgi:hypothetical protein